MRIISQDGKTDLPYDSLGLFVEDNIIMAESLNRERMYAMAEYSSEEKAVEALDKFKKVYAVMVKNLDFGAVVHHVENCKRCYYQFEKDEV